mmetsp:Transcript_2042/g.2356  ORF Transcript_2042/g.2356 Transcript_2042/m.2356 type:complete len:82 (-) Transcript_2042:207-452(-)
MYKYKHRKMRSENWNRINSVIVISSPFSTSITLTSFRHISVLVHNMDYCTGRDFLCDETVDLLLRAIQLHGPPPELGKAKL